MRLSLAALLPLVLVAHGCNEADPLEREVRLASARFIADEVPGTTTSRYVTLETSRKKGGRITLDVVLHEIDEPVASIAVKLTYPKDFSKALSCSGGDLFPSSECLFSEPARGSGIVFLSVSEPARATAVSGSRTILRAKFLTFGKGGGDIVFEAQNLGGSDASAVLDPDGEPILMEWYAGTLVGE